MRSPELFLVHGEETLVLGDQSLAIGRLPECNLALAGWEVSRRHARIVPTPAGPVLVDRSRFGTFVNSRQVIGPLLLTDGDVLRVGIHEMHVTRVAPAGFIRRNARPPVGRIGSWWRRFAIPELAGGTAAVVGAVVTLRLGGGTPLAAAAAVGAEAAWFYLSLAARDLRHEAREQHAGGRPFDRRAAADVLRNLLNEFGIAEGIDLLLRPIGYGIGLTFLGPVAGILLGKIVADILFYGPILATWHWRLARPTPHAGSFDRLRPTTAQHLPVGRLAEFHVKAEQAAAEQPDPPRIGTEP